APIMMKGRWGSWSHRPPGSTPSAKEDRNVPALETSRAILVDLDGSSGHGPDALRRGPGPIHRLWLSDLRLGLRLSSLWLSRLRLWVWLWLSWLGRGLCPVSLQQPWLHAARRGRRLSGIWLWLWLCLSRYGTGDGLSQPVWFRFLQPPLRGRTDALGNPELHD